MRIYLVVNVSRVVKYRKPVKRQKVEEPKLVKVDEVEEQEVEKILNKKKIQVIKYLVHQKGFTAKNDIWEKEKDLENIKEIVEEFKKRMNIKVRR